MSNMRHLKKKKKQKARLCVQKKYGGAGGQSSDKSVPAYRALVQGRGGEEGSNLSGSDEAG